MPARLIGTRADAAARNTREAHRQDRIYTDNDTTDPHKPTKKRKHITIDSDSEDNSDNPDIAAIIPPTTATVTQTPPTATAIATLTIASLT